MTAILRRVRYWRHAPSWVEASASEIPLFVAPLTMRSAWRRIGVRGLTQPGIIVGARRAGAQLRDVLRFLLWLDTASCFAVESVDAVDRVTTFFGSHLPPPRQLRPRASSVAGVLIVKNEEEHLSGALESLGPLVDELVVVDDHSSDATADIARRSGASVISRRLEGDFAAQRNAGLDVVRTDWVIAIDADERLEPAVVPLVRRALDDGVADAIFVPILNLITERGDEPVHWPDFQPRVFRSRLRYRGAVHERIEGWRRPVFLPVSGPYIRHEKSLLRQHRGTLLYDRMSEVSPYPRELIEQVREEVSRLERDERARGTR